MYDSIVVLGIFIGVFVLLSLIFIRHIYTFIVAVLLILMPLSGADFAPRQIMGITGLNAVNLVWCLALVAVFYTHRSINDWEKARPFFSWPLVLFFFFYLLAFIWTVTNLDSLMPPKHPETVMSMSLQKLFKPIQVVLTGWIVYMYCRTKNSRAHVETVLLLTPIILAPIAMWYFAVGSIDGGYRAGRSNISSIGLHANTLGALAVALLGCALGMFDYSRQRLRYLAIGCTLFLVAVSFSRMAFITAIILLLVSFRRLSYKQRVLVVSMGAGVVLFFATELLLRVQYGFDPSSGVVDVDKVSAGRLEGIWQPLLPQIWDNLVVGEGLLSIWKAEANKSQYFPSHPHNAYMQILLDMGVVGLVALVLMLRAMWRLGASGMGLRYALLSWLCMGLSGTSFYPKVSNYIIWVILGMIAALPRPAAKTYRRSLMADTQVTPISGRADPDTDQKNDASSLRDLPKRLD